MANNAETRAALTRFYRSGRKLPRRSLEQVEAAVEEIHAMRESGERPSLSNDDVGDAFLTRIQSASARWHAHHNSAKSRAGLDLNAAADVPSDLIEVCILSEFALQPRSGMRLRDSATDTDRKGGAFKIPMSVLLNRTGVDLSPEPTGAVSLIVSEGSEGWITQVRLTASRDAEFPEASTLEVVLEDDLGHQFLAWLSPDNRVFVIQTDGLSGSAREIRVKARLIHAG
jgi:hypothetical protein